MCIPNKPLLDVDKGTAQRTLLFHLPFNHDVHAPVLRRMLNNRIVTNLDFN